ncbi:MAG TPA: hypothetical protein VGV09_02945 [Steroidobacteraceae bacterium]|nr:hypothetical protein [Steroidobacteraceae bacterium]
MKRLMVAALVLFSMPLQAAPFIAIGDLHLYLASQTRSPSPLKEYLPTGEKFESWNRLASIRIFSNLNDPGAYLEGLGKHVVKDNPAAHYQILKNGSGTIVLDFLTFSDLSIPKPFAEWNLMKATYVPGKGLVLYQYAMRIYVIDDALPGKVIAERNKVLTAFANATFAEADGG